MRKAIALVLIICAVGTLFFLMRKGSVSPHPLLRIEEIKDFDVLMGKGGPVWQHVQTREDRQHIQFFKQAYDKNITFLNAPDLSTRIPQVLHFIWLGPKEFPEGSKKNLRSWIEKHPGWKVKFWTDIDRDIPLPGMEKVIVEETHLPRLLSCYFDADNFIEKSLVLRYEILFQEGGVYLDHDVECKASCDSLNASFDFYCGLEPLAPSILSSSVYTSPHLIATIAQHPILNSAIEWLKKRWDVYRSFYSGTDPILVHNRAMHRSVSALLEGVLNKLDRENFRDIVFPSQIFSGGLLAKHEHASLWLQQESSFEKKMQEKLSELSKKSRETELFLLIGVGLNLLLLAFGLYTLKNLKRKVHEAS